MQLISSDYLTKTGRDDLISLDCPYCKNAFKTKRFLLQRNIKSGRLKFCSAKCSSLSQRNRVECICAECNKMFIRTPAWVSKFKRAFCSQTCSGSYNNKHKTYGTRRSKLEIWIEEKLEENFKQFDIHFNRKDAIESELDIFIPHLKLAFELNGIHHYRNIHGDAVFKRVQANDRRKASTCREKNVELVVINTSMQKRFTKESSIEFLELIKGHINKRISDTAVAEK